MAEKQVFTNRTITVSNDMDFYYDVFPLRVYNDTLWADGGSHDDFLIRRIDELEGTDEGAEVEITITDKDIEQMVFFSNNYEELE